MSSYRDRRGTPASPPPRPGRKGFDLNQLPVWFWVAILFLALIVGGAFWLLTRNAEAPAVATPTPAATSATPRPGTPGAVTPTPVIAANTPTPAPSTQIAPGIRAQVVGVGADQLSVRGGPGAANARIGMVADGVKLKVLEGPETADGKQWWRVQLDDGAIGWVVADYLKPAQ